MMIHTRVRACMYEGGVGTEDGADDGWVVSRQSEDSGPDYIPADRRFCWTAQSHQGGFCLFISLGHFFAVNFEAGLSFG
jgi:hypothetical protein